MVFTPGEAGADPSGVNATDNHYALVPGATAKNALVLHIPSSLASPANQIKDPQFNFYNAAAQAGFHVLALSYRNNGVLGITCGDNDACYPSARETVITGVAVSGVAPSLSDMRQDEGIYQRTFAALVLLDAAYPNAGWGQFIGNASSANAADRVAWDKVVATGHSQGGGHAAYLGKLVALRRVVQLSSTCDAVNNAPASWTLQSNGTWATSPAQRYVGLAAPGDTICPHHVAIWQAMGMDPTRSRDDAQTCGAPGNTHGVTLGCVDNFVHWGMLLE